MMDYAEQRKYVDSWLASRERKGCTHCEGGVVMIEWLSVVTFAPCPNCGGLINGNHTGEREIHVVKERVEAI